MVPHIEVDGRAENWKWKSKKSLAAVFGWTLSRRESIRKRPGLSPAPGLKAVCPKGGDTVGPADSRGDFMADYAPASRRPISDIFRRTAHPAVRFCVRRGIHPDAVSYASIGAAAAAALCFWQAQ